MSKPHDAPLCKCHACVQWLLGERARLLGEHEAIKCGCLELERLLEQGGFSLERLADGRIRLLRFSAISAGGEELDCANTLHGLIKKVGAGHKWTSRARG